MEPGIGSEFEVGESHPLRLPVLRRGSTGGHVRRLQQQLGYFNLLPRHYSRGTFDEATERAVERFQRESGLGADGIVSPFTWQKLGERITSAVG
jgi:peptidoglycan hydrolase-like protein with peptidoglycan-binding domain